MWLRRWEAYDYNNPFFKPEGEYNTSPASSRYALPNCTLAAMLVAYEGCGKAIKGIAKKGTYDYGTAKNWYEQTGLPKGSEMREGAIAVFDGSSGHVLTVEMIKDSTHAMTIESNFSPNKNLRDWHFFNRRDNLELVVGKATVPGVGKLLGFIYVPINDKRVERDPKVEQVEISAEKVNCRKAPGGEVVSKGCYVASGIYNVLDKKEHNGSMWYELDKNYWVSDGWWMTHYDAEQATVYLNELDKEIEEMEGIIKVLSGTSSSLRDILD